MKHFIGMDGGGSKTEFVLLNENGKVKARHFEGSSYYLQIGMNALRDLVTNGVRACAEQAQISIDEIDYGFFGFPAFGEDRAIQSELETLPSKIMPVERFQCGNDMVCGWAGSLACQDGINIVAGTGSIAYGENNGKSARAGGYGELFSDEGSAYWIGIKGLNTFTKILDGRVAKSDLYYAFMTEFGFTHPMDICEEFMGQKPKSRDEIAAVSRLVANAARKNDLSAIAIFDQAAKELCSIVEALRAQLDFTKSETIKLSYSGGVFKSGELILRPLTRELCQTEYKYQLLAPISSPAIGAATYAAKRNGIDFAASQISELAPSSQ